MSLLDVYYIWRQNDERKETNNERGLERISKKALSTSPRLSQLLETDLVSGKIFSESGVSMRNKQGFVGALRKGEREFAERNSVKDAKMLVSAYRSNIKLYKGLGWDTRENEGKLRIAKRRLREVLASGSKDIDYDKKGNLI